MPAFLSLSTMGYSSTLPADWGRSGILLPVHEVTREPLRDRFVDRNRMPLDFLHFRFDSEDFLSRFGPVDQDDLAPLAKWQALLVPGRRRECSAKGAHSRFIPFLIVFASWAGEPTLVAGYHRVPADFTGPKHEHPPSVFGLAFFQSPSGCS